MIKFLTILWLLATIKAQETMNIEVDIGCDNWPALFYSIDNFQTSTAVCNPAAGCRTIYQFEGSFTAPRGATLRIGCWDFGKPGRLYGDSTITVDGTQYTITGLLNAGDLELVGFEQTCPGHCDGQSACLNDVPTTLSDLDSVTPAAPTDAIIQHTTHTDQYWVSGRIDQCGIFYSDFTPHNNYYFVSDKLRFSEAKAYCEMAYLNGHLAVIENTNDQNAVNHQCQNIGQLQSACWIGITNPAISGNKWVDGTPITYTNWADGGDGGAGQPCTTFRVGGAWYTVGYCENGGGAALPFVCQGGDAQDVDCGLGDWYDVGTCDASCGGGNQNQQRDVVIPPAGDGAACGATTQIIACNEQSCAIDCVLGDWENVGECSTLCGTGTQNQERNIEIHPANGGAACGATTQTISCNEHGCCPNGIKTFDWDRMTGMNENAPTYENFVFNVENTDLTLNIYVELPYLGYTSADHQREAKYGTTYVLDFEDFNAHKDSINEPGTCQNRMHNSFTGKIFNDFWSYSDEPQNPNGIGSINTLAYPPSDKWTMYMKDDGCDTIVYERSFTWQELRDCSGYGGNIPFTSVVHEDNKYELSGTFYINVVSPFWYDSDFGYYRVYQLLSQPFAITVSSVVNVLGDTGINLITMWIIAVYKESQEAGQYTSQQDFRLVVMTETAEYMTLTRTTNSPFNFVKAGSNNNNINSNIFTVDDTPEDGCLNNRDYICTQLWRIDALNPGCSVGENGFGTDFSGNYELGFTPQCSGSNDVHCNNFLNKHTDIRDNLLISADLIWRDNICDAKVFELQFQANMLFYEEGNQFVTPIGDTHLFQAGVDTIYVEIDTTFPDNTFEIFNTDLTNVWICTFDPNIIPGSFQDVIDGTIQLNEMGCFNNGKDSSLSNIVNDIYPIPTNDIVNFQLYNEAESNIIQFSFLIPEEVTRDTLYIHAQIEVELQEPITQTRRRMLLDVNSANQISHFGQEIGIKNKKNNKNPKPQPQLPINEPQLPVLNTPIYLSLNSTWVIVIGSLLALILTCNICFMCYMNYCKNKRGKKGYKKVKYIDSEFDSEAQMIDNQ